MSKFISNFVFRPLFQEWPVIVLAIGLALLAGWLLACARARARRWSQAATAGSHGTAATAVRPALLGRGPAAARPARLAPTEVLPAVPDAWPDEPAPAPVMPHPAATPVAVLPVLAAEPGTTSLPKAPSRPGWPVAGTTPVPGLALPDEGPKTTTLPKAAGRRGGPRPR
jgi:hypothetical protein